ncbi:MAG: hypothetical protein MJY67_04865 [Bacteroidales bacterium]|nr:hypothetical protein [Bacteroidales bacterium]
MKLKIALSLALVLMAGVSLNAIDKETGKSVHHEFRIGWGDMMYETAVYHNNLHHFDYKYTGHFFGEYMYRPTHWFAVGAGVDFEEVMWTDENLGKGRNYWNLSVLPTVRFTWVHTPYVNLYTSLYQGLCVNGGTEVDVKGRKTALAPAVGISLLGIQIGDAHWFGTIELGALNAMMSAQEIYMAGSRLISVSLGYRF